MGIERYGLRVLRVYPETISDGEGLRFAIYLAGCTHSCAGCHNPESWAPSMGRLLDEPYLAAIVSSIQGNLLLDGVTLSGGDPFYNPEGLCELLHRLKESCACDIWCYTGYRLEELACDASRAPALAWIDTLVDGPFVEALALPELRFRGSSNQRILKGPWDAAAISLLVRSLQANPDAR